MTELSDATERVRKYVETIDAHTGNPSYGDIIHALNDVELRRSDLRLIVRGGGVAVTREFVDQHGMGYVIEHTDHGYRHVWREPGEPDEESIWFATEPGAVKAAWADWAATGYSLDRDQWARDLAASAKEA